MKVFSRSIICRRGIVGAVFLLAVFLTYHFSLSTCAADGLVPCKNDCNLCYLIVGISNIFQYLTGALLTVAVVLGIVISGLTYIISGAFPKVLTFAKSVIGSTMKGAILALIAWIIINGIMNIVGYKHPLGGKWYQFDCSSTGETCTSSNKTLQSIKIQCSEKTTSASSDDGSGFYVALDTLSEGGNGKTQQLKAIGKYSCDGTTSEEDITSQVEWKASDETQIKVAKGLVQSVTTSLGSSSESVPYVEAKYQEKNSNQAKVYINSCPSTETANSEIKNKFSFSENSLKIPKANAQANTSGSANCKSCGQNDTCHFIYGNKDNPQAILLLQRTNKYTKKDLVDQCKESYGDWKKEDNQQLKIFKDLVEKMSRGIDRTSEKNSFAVWRSDLIDEKDSSCPNLSTAYGYILNRKAVGSFRNEAHAGPPSYYCLNDSRAAFLLAHEQLGHDYAGLSDEYVECTARSSQFNIKKNYNCTSESDIERGTFSTKTKWGSISFPAPWAGCAYHSAFVRSSYSNAMNGSGRFGEINDKIIKFKLENNTEPAQWAETLNTNETCKKIKEFF